jgi:hypothetical protein
LIRLEPAKGQFLNAAATAQRIGEETPMPAAGYWDSP